eukprot:1158208-Pelagomonas_calceolata.AAC.46
MLSEAVSTVSGGVELELPDERFVTQYDLKHLNNAKDDAQCVEEMERCITEWCRATEDLLAQDFVASGSAPIQQASIMLPCPQRSALGICVCRPAYIVTCGRKY